MLPTEPSVTLQTSQRRTLEEKSLEIKDRVMRVWLHREEESAKRKKTDRKLVKTTTTTLTAVLTFGLITVFHPVGNVSSKNPS